MSEGIAGMGIVECAQWSVTGAFGWVVDSERHDLHGQGGVGAMVGQGPPYERALRDVGGAGCTPRARRSLACVSCERLDDAQALLRQSAPYGRERDCA